MKRQKFGLIFILMLIFCLGILGSITAHSTIKTPNVSSLLLNIKPSSSDYEKDFEMFLTRPYGIEAQGIDLSDLGDIYITGWDYIDSPHNCDAFIAKYNSSGDLKWESYWDVADHDRAYDVALNDSENIYIVGNYDSMPAEAFIAQYDSSGNSIKNITWGENIGAIAKGIVLDGAGNIYITGGLGGDASIMKFNSSGDLVMNITWGGINGDLGHDIALDGSGNIYITGKTNSFSTGGWDAFIAQFNSSGDSVLNITWGGSDDDWSEGIALDDSGNMYITGYSESLSATNSAFIAKFDISGNSIMNITYDRSVGAYGKSIALDTSGNIYISGQTYTDADAFIAKYDSSGNSLENITWGPGGSGGTRALFIDGSKNIYATGWLSSSAHTIKYKYNAPSLDYGGEDDAAQETIPGYDLFLLIGFFGILSIFHIKKRIK